jgi:methylenetetrahydrofolate dehydrogenase (NADP+) / methenyltetrahydrofolate cyclohydrolase
MILDGKKIADEIQKEIKKTIADLSLRYPSLRPPGLTAVMVGEYSVSQIYVNRKIEACAVVGIRSFKRELPATITENELLQEIEALNQNPLVDGILVQLPLPPTINPTRITHHLQPDKDVDGFHPYNIGKLLIGETDGFCPCTPLGIKTLLDRSSIELTGKHVLIIGRSNIVGKPLAALLLQRKEGGDATITVANRHSVDLKKLCLSADILIVAIGQPQLIQADMVREGAIVIDVGINKIPNPNKKQGYQIVGDVDFVHVAPKCAYITPVPGGIGPMTIAMLLHNTLLSYQKRFHLTSPLLCI